MRCHEFAQDLAPRLTRIGLGTLLLTAALLKGQQVVFDVSMSGGGGMSRAFAFGLISFECVLAVWLFSGWQPRRASAVAIVAFSCFACYSLLGVAQGATSCGCFGQVDVSPRLALLVDLAALGMLVWVRRSTASICPDPRPGFQAPASAGRIVTACCVVIALATAWAISGNGFGWLRGVMSGQLVVLEPHSWIGSRLPILDHIDIGKQLATGQRRVLLYHHDCAECQRWIARYRAPATGSSDEINPMPVALVEMPPYGPSQLDLGMTEGLLQGRLSNAQEWFARTPLHIEMSDGIVKSVSP